MGKLWDALKKAEREGQEDYVREYERSFKDLPEDFAAELDLNLSPNMSEEFRKLMSVVKQFGADSEKVIKTIMVTSSNFGEGSSTIAIALATGAARDKRAEKVLLIDANLRQPSIHEAFNIRPAPGLIEVVTDFEHRMEFFRSSPVRLVPNLHLLTVGNIDDIQHNPIEILEHKHMKTFMGEIRAFYDLIVVDSAPTIPFSDAMIMAGHVDGTLLVIDATSTRWEVAKRARDQLTFANANLLGTVLNKRKFYIPKAVYKRF